MRVLGATARFSRVGGWRLSRVGRPAVVLLACLVGVGVFLVGAVAVSGGRVLGPARGVSRLVRQVLRLGATGTESAALGRGGVRGLGGFADDLTLAGTGTVSFSAVVKPNGRVTTAYFEFGLGTRYREPRPSGVVYDQSTPKVHLGPGFGPHSVSGRVSGLVPNALYHLRLVALSSAGTVYSRDAPFRTAKDPAPPIPRIGATMNVEPVSGLVFFQPPRSKSSDAGVAGLVAGDGFLPLTEPRQLPIDSQIDPRAGAMRLVLASPQRPHNQRVTLAGGLFSLSQTRHGLEKGLTTLDLLEDDFPGAPTYNSCVVHTSADALDAEARTAQSSSLVLQTLRARDQDGRFRTRGRYSATTVTGAGTVWDTIDRCDGTLTVVHRGTVIVSDLGLGTTIALHAGQRYLAKAP
jgi:hypothetical protein